MGSVSSCFSTPEIPLQTRDLPTNTQAAEDKPGETGVDPAESGTGGYKGRGRRYLRRPPQNLTPTPNLQTTVQAVEAGRNTDEELDPKDYMKTDDRLTEEENLKKFSADESEPAASRMAASYQHGYKGRGRRYLRRPPKKFTPTPNLQTTVQAEAGRNTDEELDPADYMKTDDNEKRAKRNSIPIYGDFKGFTEEENVKKFSSDESEPAASRMAVSYQHDPNETDMLVSHHKPVAEPRSRLGSKMPPETETNKETRPDQAAGDVLQPPLTKTNPGEENLQEGDTQVSEDKTPDGAELDL